MGSDQTRTAVPRADVKEKEGSASYLFCGEKIRDGEMGAEAGDGLEEGWPWDAAECWRGPKMLAAVDEDHLMIFGQIRSKG